MTDLAFLCWIFCDVVMFYCNLKYLFMGLDIKGELFFSCSKLSKWGLLLSPTKFSRLWSSVCVWTLTVFHFVYLLQHGYLHQFPSVSVEKESRPTCLRSWRSEAAGVGRRRNQLLLLRVKSSVTTVPYQSDTGRKKSRHRGYHRDKQQTAHLNFKGSYIIIHISITKDECKPDNVHVIKLI